MALVMLCRTNAMSAQVKPFGSRLARMKRTKKSPKQKKEKGRETAPNPQHKRVFDQLLDDAIFGVKRKDQRG
jgi:hypothetical protein